MILFDSHAHLDDKKFDMDRPQVIEQAIQAGVKGIVNPGVDLETSTRAVALADEYDMVYAGVGVHPHEVKTMDDHLLSMIEALSYKPKVKAIGEIGLDFYRDFSPREAQERWFRAQIKLAKMRHLPIIIHDREANDQVLRVLKEERAFETGVVMHSFSGSAELARQYVTLGALISISGPVTFKNARVKREVAQVVPLERLLIETDSPYLTAEPKRGMRNEPAYVMYTCDKIAQLKDISPELVGEVTYKNAMEFFKIDG